MHQKEFDKQVVANVSLGAYYLADWLNAVHDYHVKLLFEQAEDDKALHQEYSTKFVKCNELMSLLNPPDKILIY